MADREGFSGNALQAVDAKGRVAIPATFRQVIELNTAGEKVVMLGDDPDRPVLTGFDRGYVRRLMALGDAQATADIAAGRAPKRDYDDMFGGIDPTGFDDSGRFVLSPYFRSVAGLENWACFVGRGHFFEIWSPANLLAAEDVPENVKRRLRFELAAKGIAL